jgi:hypothetical protein
MPTVEQAFLPPDDRDAPIWKYMDRWKFTSLLENGLYFCRLDALPDPYEGSTTQPDHEQYLEQYGKTVVNASAHFSAIHSLKRVMVNCWHMNTVESEGMWRLYVKEAPAGVCIQSTYARLRDCLGASVKGIGMVNYVDYDNKKMEMLHPFYSTYLHRPSWYKHEQELRALIYDPDSDIPEKGACCKVDCARLIERVVISPYAEASLHESVHQEIARHGLIIPVAKSALTRPPIR